MRILLIFIIGLNLKFCFSQNEGSIWYLGDYAGLDFSNGQPVPLMDGQMTTLEGCASIANAEGELLFYTNGEAVWDRNHDIMPNGADLYGHNSATNSALILPKPGVENTYYLFTLDERGYENGLRYSELDMTLNNGLGNITDSKNILLSTPMAEKMTAMKISGENAYWLLVHKYSNNEFMAFKVTESGIDDPVISAVGTDLSTHGSNLRAIGQIKISPDGNKVAVANFGHWQAQLFDFDQNTGVVSNPLTLIQLDEHRGVYGVEFSPNSELLYIAISLDGVFQFNLNGSHAEIVDSAVNISNQIIDTVGMQLGPNGKIYVARGGSYYLGAINNPDQLGQACNYSPYAIFLGGDNHIARSGLPPFIQTSFNFPFVVENTCIGDATRFTINADETYDSVLWDFGDGSSSTFENPEHIYTSPGSYLIELTVFSGSTSTSSTKEIVVSEYPEVYEGVIIGLCDTDNDGLAYFDLNDAPELLTSNTENLSFTYYETEMDALNSANIIIHPFSYQNEVPENDSIWVRVENNHGCFVVVELGLQVSVSEIPSSFTHTIYRCDDGLDIEDGVAIFDLNEMTNEIENLFPTNSNLIIKYYQNEADVLSQSNAILNESSYENTQSPNQQTLFISVVDGISGACLGIGDYLTLIVDPKPLITGPVIRHQCDQGSDGIETFSTAGIVDELLIGQTLDIEFSYINEFGHDYGTSLPAEITINTQILNIFATMTATNPDNPNGGCSVQTTISFLIDAGYNNNVLTDQIVCDTDADGFYDFDTSSFDGFITNNEPNLSVYYFDQDGNSLPSPLPNPYHTDSQSITVHVMNDLNPMCVSEFSFDFVVHLEPTANVINHYVVCSATGFSEIVLLSDFDGQILGNQPEEMFDILYFDSVENAENNISPLPVSFEIINPIHSLVARIQNVDNNDCFSVTEFELGKIDIPIAYAAENISACDDASNDGYEFFDLSQQNDMVLQNQDASAYEITYHISQEEANLGSNPIDLLYENVTNPQTLFARISSQAVNDCYDTTSFQIEVNAVPQLDIDNEVSICEGASITLEGPVGNFYYLWSTGATTRSIIIDTPGTYSLTVENVSNECSVSQVIEVVESTIATIISIETEDWSQNDNTISVIVEGIGDYEYSIDGINYQDSNIFTNLEINEYLVYVRDKNGCGETEQEVYLMYYPKFFTPNGDGYHDYWQLYSADKESNNRLFIYDRYGKLLKELNSKEVRWDGSFNGRRLPSSDYWFRLERENGKQYTGHFSLKY